MDSVIIFYDNLRSYVRYDFEAFLLDYIRPPADFAGLSGYHLFSTIPDFRLERVCRLSEIPRSQRVEKTANKWLRKQR